MLYRVVRSDLPHQQLLGPAQLHHEALLSLVIDPSVVLTRHSGGSSNEGVHDCRPPENVTCRAITGAT